MIQEQHFYGSRPFIEVDCRAETHRGVGLVYQAFIQGFANPDQVQQARLEALRHEQECKKGLVTVTYFDDRSVGENAENAPLDATGEMIPNPYDPEFRTYPKKQVEAKFDYGWRANDQAEIDRLRGELKGILRSEKKAKHSRRNRWKSF